MRKKGPMKKLIFVLVIFYLCFFGVAVAKEACKYGDGDLDLDFIENDEIWIEASTGQSANGLLCTHCSVSGYYFEFPYKNGKLEGIVMVYKENGKLWREKPYKNGRAEGITRTYYESGELKYEEPYKNDKAEGIAKFTKKTEGFGARYSRYSIATIKPSVVHVQMAGPSRMRKS